MFQATPTLAGNAVLVREYFVRGFYPSGQASAKDGFVPSGALIKAILLHSGQKMTMLLDDKFGSIPLDSYPSNIQGYGRPQLDTVLNFARAETTPLNLLVLGAAISSHPLFASFSNTGEQFTYVISTGPSATEIKVTLTYTDKAGAAGSAKPLVNDLDVSVIQQSNNQRYLPIPFNANSRVGNIEVIIIPDPIPYTNYTVIVSAYSLSTAQPYALVITGHVIAYNSTSSSKKTLPKWLLHLKNISPEAKAIITSQAIAFFVLLVIVVSIVRVNSRPGSRANNPRVPYYRPNQLR